MLFKPISNSGGAAEQFVQFLLRALLKTVFIDLFSIWNRWFRRKCQLKLFSYILSSDSHFL